MSPTDRLRSVSGGSRQWDFRVLRHEIEELLKLLKRIFSKTVGSADPYTRNDGLLEPDLVLFPEKPDIDQVVEGLTSCDVAADNQ